MTSIQLLDLFRDGARLLKDEGVKSYRQCVEIIQASDKKSYKESLIIFILQEDRSKQHEYDYIRVPISIPSCTVYIIDIELYELPGHYDLHSVVLPK